MTANMTDTLIEQSAGLEHDGYMRYIHISKYLTSVRNYYTPSSYIATNATIDQEI